MIALVTGGAGVVGKALCRELLARDVCVRVLVLPGDTQAGFLPRGVEVFYGDVSDYEYFLSRKSELYCYDRADVKVLAGWVVSAPADFAG